MGTPKIVDTNVPLTAITTEETIPAVCRRACVKIIGRILAGDILVVLDDQNEALREYRQQMYPDPNPSAGLASQFLMYLFNYQYDLNRVRRVPIQKLEDGSYDPFPDDDELRTFDPSDRKWVAIAISFENETSDKAAIVNATDSDWLHFEHTLQRLGIKIEFLCKDILKAKEE